jgi:hypothetical protein
MNVKTVKNGYKSYVNGWNYVAIWGKPYERGFAHGSLLKNEIKEAIDTMKWSLLDSQGFDENFFIEFSNFLFKDTIKTNFPELYEELEGISKGSGIHIDEIILWNNNSSLDYALPKLKEYISKIPKLEKKYGDLLSQLPMTGQLEGGSSDKCSAFMALEPYTSDGKIVCAHNSFDDFISGQFFNCILSITPEKGCPMIFQTAPGYICSFTDFVITGYGFIVTETTIGGFLPYEHKLPISCRIRKAMQYAKTLDDYVKILKNGNSGDYANSWLIGDINNNEIMKIELGLKLVSVERKKKGYFIGFNAPYDPRIRNLECNNSGFDDIRRHQGARKVRLEELMEKYKGNIDVPLAKEIIADHFDVYLNKINMCSRTVCSHYELDNRQFMSQADRPLPYQPRGAVDGTCTSSELAKKMKMWGRWGSSCGTPFYVKPYIDINKQWKRYEPWLKDRPEQPWTLFQSLGNISKKELQKRIKQEEKYHTIEKKKIQEKSPYYLRFTPQLIKEKVDTGVISKKEEKKLMKKEGKKLMKKTIKKQIISKYQDDKSKKKTKKKRKNIKTNK